MGNKPKEAWKLNGKWKPVPRKGGKKVPPPPKKTNLTRSKECQGETRRPRKFQENRKKSGVRDEEEGFAEDMDTAEGE